MDGHLISAVAGTSSSALHVLQSFGSFFSAKLGWKHRVFIDSFHSFMPYVLYRFSAEGKHATC